VSGFRQIETCVAGEGMVASADDRAAQAGVAALARGGNAIDAAISAGVMAAVTLPHMSGLGGDLFAIVHREGEPPIVLNASGRAPTGADPAKLRGEGYDCIPLRDDLRSVTVPGCVDGWTMLHERFGRLALSELLEPAQKVAQDGFRAQPELFAASRDVLDIAGAEAFSGITSPESLVRTPGVARDLLSIMEQGRQGFYAGAFGRDLVEMSEGLFTSADLEAVHGDWVSPLRIRVFDHDVWAVPPNSPGYIVLGAAWLSQRIGLPDDITDPAWPHLLIEAVRQASFDRRAVLYQDSDGAALISEERLRPRLENIQTRRSTSLGGTYVSGDTTYLCVVDGERTAVSLIQSLAKPFGSHLFMQGHDSVLNNRGVSFSLEPGHPAELRPGRRPPHTLAPLLVTRPDGKLQTILGTMGGDIQPQVLLQLLVRTLVLRESPAYSLAAARWALSSENTTGFDTWDDGLAAVRVLLESDCPEPWVNGLVERGHQVEVLEPLANRFGHAALISVLGDALAGASDPRAASSGVRGYN